MILDATTKTIEVVLEGAITTNQLDVTSGFADSYPGGNFLPGEQDTSTNGATPVTAVSAPVANVQRMVNEIRVYNKDTVLHTITIQLNNNGTRRVLQSEPCAPGAVVVYAPSGGTLTDRAPLNFIELESGTLPEKISSMAAASLPTAGTEVFPLVQSGTNVTLPFPVFGGAGTTTLAPITSTDDLNVQSHGGHAWIFSGDLNSASTTGEAFIFTGSNTGSGASGDAGIASGNTNSGNSGPVTFGTGNSTSGASGQTTFFTGDGATSTGNIVIGSGNASAGNSGSVAITVGTASGAGKSTGNITLTLVAGSGGASNGNLLIVNLPTSSAGLPANAIWCDTGAGNVLKRV